MNTVAAFASPESTGAFNAFRRPAPQPQADPFPDWRQVDHYLNTLKEEKLSETRRRLYGVQVPMGAAAGVVTYYLLQALNEEKGLIKDFEAVLETRSQLSDEIRRILDTAARRNKVLPPKFKTSLSQLNVALTTGSPPHVIVGLMDDVGKSASNPALTSNLNGMIHRYVNHANKILTNGKGLRKLAEEPLVQKLLGLSKSRARVLVRQDRQAFVEALFRNALHGMRPAQLKTVFKRLGQVHQRVPRLIGAAVAVILSGYYVVKYELLRRKLGQPDLSPEEIR